MPVLQVLLILSQKAEMDSCTAEATMTMSLVLSKLLMELPDMGEAATLLAAEPPGINPDLVLGLVQQLKQFLRRSIQFAPSSVSLGLDGLSRLWFLALPKHGIPSEILQEGQLLSSYCAHQPWNVLAFTKNQQRTATTLLIFNASPCWQALRDPIKLLGRSLPSKFGVSRHAFSSAISLCSA